MNFRQDNTWVGVAVKGGGMLAVVGFETLVGSICRLDGLFSASNYWACGATPGVRLGLGLGGSVGLTFILVYGTQFFIDVHKLDIGGPNVIIAIDDKVGDLSKVSKLDKAAYASLKAFAGVAKDGGKLADVKLNVIMNIVNNIMNGISWAGGSRPFGMAIDIPFAGTGMELSAFWTIEYKLELQGLMT